MSNDSTPETFEIDDAQREVMERHARHIAENHGSSDPFTASHVFRPPASMTPGQGIGLLGVMALVLLSSFAGGRLMALLGVRGFALVMLVPAVVAAVGMRGAPRAAGLSLAERVALLATLVIAITTGSELCLQLLPAIVHAAVARLMMASLAERESLIERAARVAHPLAPEFIRPYCRKLTAVWAAMFGASAVVIAAAALLGFGGFWRMWCDWLFWSLVGAFVVVEFFWRKAWFRYFGQGPFDQFLARVFPPERTPRGRRSMAYMLAMREELARMAERHRRSQQA